jgi:hypothetical protein
MATRRDSVSLPPLQLIISAYRVSHRVRFSRSLRSRPANLLLGIICTSRRDGVGVGEPLINAIATRLASGEPSFWSLAVTASRRPRLVFGRFLLVHVDPMVTIVDFVA